MCLAGRRSGLLSSSTMSRPTTCITLYGLLFGWSQQKLPSFWLAQHECICPLCVACIFCSLSAYLLGVHACVNIVHCLCNCRACKCPLCQMGLAATMLLVSLSATSKYICTVRPTSFTSCTCMVVAQASKLDDHMQCRQCVLSSSYARNCRPKFALLSKKDATNRQTTSATMRHAKLD